MTDPWERRPDESARAYETFRAYRDAGPLRALGPVAAQLGAHPSTIRRWASRFEWTSRAEAWDAEVHRAEDETRLAKIRDMRELHERVAQAVIERGLAALEALAVSDIPAGAAARLVELGIREQRRIMTDDEELLGGIEREDPWDKLARELTSPSVPGSAPLAG